MIYRVLLLYFALVGSAVADQERFKDVDLWLPIAYLEKWGAFFQAADKAKNDPYCRQLLSGRLSESQSSLDHPIFIFRCRAEDRTIYTIQVDGNTMMVTNAYGDQQRKLEEERLAAEAQRLEEERKRLSEEEKRRQEGEEKRRQAEEQRRLAEEQARIEEEQRKKEAEAAEQRLKEQREAEKIAKLIAKRHQEETQYWNICRSEMQKRLKNFEELTLLSDPSPEPLIQFDQFTFTLDFDAVNPMKKTLHFEISCVISALDYYRVDIKPRQNNKANSP